MNQIIARRTVTITYEDMSDGHRWEDRYIGTDYEPALECLSRHKRRVYQMVWKNNMKFDTRKIKVLRIDVTDMTESE